MLLKRLRNQGVEPTRIVTDRLGSYVVLDVGGGKNNRAECSHVPTRKQERKVQKFKSVRNAQ